MQNHHIKISISQISNYIGVNKYWNQPNTIIHDINKLLLAIAPSELTESLREQVTSVKKQSDTLKSLAAANYSDSNNLIELKRKITQIAPDISEEDVSTACNQTHGIINESKTQTSESLVKTQVYVSKEISIGIPNNITYTIHGYIDGMTVDKRIIEIKNRVNKLFTVVPEYELVQVLFYMYVSGNTDKSAILTQQYNGNTQHTDIPYQEERLLRYLNALNAFISRVYQFCNEHLDEYLQGDVTVKMDLISKHILK